MISNIPVFHPDLLEEKYAEYGAELAILTVSPRSAQNGGPLSGHECKGNFKLYARAFNGT